MISPVTFAALELHEPFPAADVITMGMILHDWNLETKRTLIHKAFDALPPGGCLIAVDNLIDDERRSNLFGLLMSLNMLNPLDSSHLDKVHSMASIALIALKRYDEALDRARRLGAVLPRGAGPYLTAAAAHAHRGDLDAARQAAAEVLRLRPQFVIGGVAQRGSTAPAYIEGLRHVDEGLRLAGLPERPASPAC